MGDGLSACVPSVDGDSRRCGRLAHSARRPVEDPHQQAGGLDHLGGFNDIVEVDLAVAAWVSKYRVCTREQSARSFLLARDGARVCEDPGPTPCLVHEVHPDDFVAEPAHLSDPHFDHFHRNEDPLLVLADQELRSRLGFNGGVQPSLQPFGRVERVRPFLRD
jgi:hypothetical protein